MGLILIVKASLSESFSKIPVLCHLEFSQCFGEDTVQETSLEMGMWKKDIESNTKFLSHEAFKNHSREVFAPQYRSLLELNFTQQAKSTDIATFSRVIEHINSVNSNKHTSINICISQPNASGFRLIQL